jgi:hypothetical protein
VRQNRIEFRLRILKGPGFESAPLRHTVCSVWLQFGDCGKSPREAALVRLMRTGESKSCTRFDEFLGFVSRRRKAGSLHGSGKNSLIHRLSEMEPVGALVDSDRLQLRRPFERQIDPIE